MIRRIVTGLILAALWPGLATAQTTLTAAGAPDPDTRQLGPFYLRPTLALTNAGIDTNVFNSADSENPERDFTMTVTPGVTVWLPFESTWIRGNVLEDLVWYKNFSSERSANTNASLGWTVPLSRFTLAVSGNWVRTNDRPGFEIDTRARRWERAAGGSFELRVLSRTLVGIAAERRVFDFDEDETFQGTDLRTELNRRQVTEAVTVRHELTPLTNLILQLGLQQDRFDFEPLRDADSTRVLGGFRFAPDALISGSALIGYRNFKPKVPDVPGYSGGVASVNLSYVARATTKFSAQVNRDVEYSYDVNQPYYLQTGAIASVTQQLFGPIDLEGRFTAERLAYRDRTGAQVDVPDRVDRVRWYGGGVGYHAGVDLRVAFNFDYEQRTSDVASSAYNGWRYGTAVTYGF